MFDCHVVVIVAMHSETDYYIKWVITHKHTHTVHRALSVSQLVRRRGVGLGSVDRKSVV